MEGNNYKKNQYNNNNNKGWDLTKKSHFIVIPIQDPLFIEAYSKLCEELKEANPNHFHQELLQKPGKLHMTICTLDLGEDEKKINKVNQVLSSISSEMANIASGKVAFNVDYFESMGSVTSTRIVYAKMVEDEYYTKLGDIIDLVIKTLLNEGVIQKEKLKELFIEFDKTTQKYTITLHLTLLNVLFLNKIQKKQRETLWKNFDATEILSFMNERAMPAAEINQIHFCRMREDKKTEKYELLYSYNLK